MKNMTVDLDGTQAVVEEAVAEAARVVAAYQLKLEVRQLQISITKAGSKAKTLFKTYTIILLIATQ